MVALETLMLLFCNQLEIEDTGISDSANAASNLSFSSLIKSFVILENKHGFSLSS